MSSRRLVRLALLAVSPLLVLGCVSNSPPQAILGTWQSGIGDKKRTMTFWDNGAWSFETPHGKQTGTYAFVSDKEIEMKVDVSLDAKPITYKRTVSFAHHNHMTMTDLASSRRMIWKRVD